MFPHSILMTISFSGGFRVVVRLKMCCSKCVFFMMVILEASKNMCVCVCYCDNHIHLQGLGFKL